jgi:hypothetical protein
MASSGMLRRVVLVRTHVSKELNASIIRVTIMGELGITLAVTRNTRTLRINTKLFLAHQFLLPWWWRRYVPPKHRFLQESHGVTSQKTAFFIVTAVKTSNLTSLNFLNSKSGPSDSQVIVNRYTDCASPASYTKKKERKPDHQRKRWGALNDSSKTNNIERASATRKEYQSECIPPGAT